MARVALSPAHLLAWSLLAGAVTTMATAPLSQRLRRDACGQVGVTSCADALAWPWALAQAVALALLGFALLAARGRADRLSSSGRFGAGALLLAGGACAAASLAPRRAWMCGGPECVSWTEPLALVLLVVALVGALAGLLLALDGVARLRAPSAA